MELIFFRGVGPGGYDIYGVKFANGSAEVRLQLGADGKVDDVIFRPDGNGAPGAVLACSDEAGLKPHGDSAPISVFFYNGTGKDIQLYELDSAGKRMARVRSAKMHHSPSGPPLTDHGSSPMRRGTCLEIVLPGQRTRFNTVQGARAGDQPEPSAALRTAAIGRK